MAILDDVIPLNTDTVIPDNDELLILFLHPAANSTPLVLIMGLTLLILDGIKIFKQFSNTVT